MSQGGAALQCLLGAKGMCLCPNKNLPCVLLIKKIKIIKIGYLEERKERTLNVEEI